MEGELKKASLRAFYRERRDAFQKQSALYQQTNRRLAQNIQNFVSGLPKGSLILAYQAIQSEARIPWLKGHRMACPRIREGAEFQIDFFEVKDPAQDLILNRWGIREPDPNRCQMVDPGRAQMVFIPGVAFDRTGFRLGLGKGFYDRFLATLEGGVLKLGVCFNLQLHGESLPKDLWDLPVDGLITETACIGFSRRKKK